MRALPMAVTESFWRRLLEALYTGLEGRDTSGYAWLQSDRWTQSRDATRWTGHLECWFDLGEIASVTSDAFVHAGTLAFAARYQADDDSMSQARMQAAVRDAYEYLKRVALPDGCRVAGVTGFSLNGPLSSGHVECQITFHLHVPR